MGKGPGSPHKRALNCCQDLLNSLQHIEKIIEKQTSQQVASNRLRLKASIDVEKWLAFQALSFRGHDESSNSSNPGNFLELIKLLASYNEEVAATVLEHAPKYASYLSHGIQKEILSIFVEKIQQFIRKEVVMGHGVGPYRVLNEIGSPSPIKTFITINYLFNFIFGFI